MAKNRTWSAKSLFDSFWFRLRNPQRVGRHRRAACSRLLLEQLEDRLTPSNSLGTYALLEGPASGTNSDIVVATGAWTATGNASWLHTSASGNGLAVFTFDANPGATRTGTLTIAGKTLTVTQAGSGYVAAQLATLVPVPVNQPSGVAVDSSGNIFIADTGDSAIKEYVAATHQVVTLVSSGLSAPEGVAVDGSGNVYIADTSNGAIEEWGASTQQVSTLVSGLNFPGALSELNGWVQVLNATSQAVVAADIAQSGEANDRLVRTWYQTYLGRAAVNGEEQGWVNLLTHGSTEESVLSDILGCPEFFSHAQTLEASGTPHQRYVEALYQLLLGRTGAAAEVAGWVEVFSQQGQAGVALDILDSLECRADLVEAYYNALLHRPPETAAPGAWAASGEDALTMRIGIEASEEFFTNG